MAAVLELARSVDLHVACAMLLLKRGVTTPAEALSFLGPCLDNLHDPFLLPDADKAVERIVAAIDSGETIFIHGDYDVDGVTSAALLTRVLRKLGANVVPFVPSRSRDGYGIRAATVERAHADGAGLFLSCDCGISAHDACNRARELGLDLIVTDHHQCQSTLPDAYAVVNPNRSDSAYPFSDLAGVGVAYKMCQALCIRRNVPLDALHKHFLDLVALGTVSDVVPLTGENRAYVYHGLRSIADTQKQGLLALIQASGVPMEGVDTETIGFRLGPRINAVGRLAEASTALELLLTSDADVAGRIAAEMSQTNVERQAEQSRVFQEALAAVAEDNLTEDRVLVVAREGWHAGVIGIVAGKLAELFFKPAFVLTRTDDRFHGSGRSIPGYNLAAAIGLLGDDLVQGGGHAMAAGISFEAANLEQVRKKLNDLANRWLTEEDLVPKVPIELELDPSGITLQLAQDIARLAPFGEGNREPVLATRRVKLTDIRAMGSSGNHLSAQLVGTTEAARIVGWGMGEHSAALDPTRLYRICYNLRIDSFRGTDRVTLVLQDRPVEDE